MSTEGDPQDKKERIPLERGDVEQIVELKEEELKQAKKETKRLLKMIAMIELSGSAEKDAIVSLKLEQKMQKARIKQLEKQIEEWNGLKTELFSTKQLNKVFLDSLEEELSKISLESMSMGDLQRMSSIFMDQMRRVTEHTTLLYRAQQTNDLMDTASN